MASLIVNLPRSASLWSVATSPAEFVGAPDAAIPLRSPLMNDAHEALRHGNSLARFQAGLVALAIAGTAFIAALAWLSPLALLVAVTEGLLPGLLLLSAAGWGAWPARTLLCGCAVSPALCVMAAVVVGCGILATSALVLGVSALLSPSAAWVLVAGGIVLGAAALVSRRNRHNRDNSSGSAPISRRSSAGCDTRTTSRAGATLRGSAMCDGTMRGAALIAPALCLAVMFYAATTPPGTFWIGEGNGYDVLEYHLQAPREYLDAGRIHFLPHNVYAQFPQQVELLYLLLMHLHGGSLEAAIPCQLLHALFGVLAVCAVAALAPTGWGRIAAACITASVPWFSYVGALAYNELAGLLFAVVAVGLLQRERCGAASVGASDGVEAQSTAACVGLRQIMLSGLCAGVAAGCKYTLLALVVVPLMVLAAAMAGRSHLAIPAAGGAGGISGPRPVGVMRRRALATVAFAIAAVVAFSPWLVRNVAFTGNPVYPFAYEWFGGAGWSAEQAAQWAAGHRPKGDGSEIAIRAGLLWRELAASPMFGVLTWVALLLAAVSAWSCVRVRLLTAWLLIGVATWAALTHMPGRFLVVLIGPVALIIGRGAASLPKRSGRALAAIVAGAAAVAAVFNASTVLGLLRAQEQFWEQRAGLRVADLIDRTALRAQMHPVNTGTPPDARIRTIGDAAVFYVRRPLHYTVVFNRDPWIEFARGRSAAEAVSRLRAERITHVVFSWSEISRLRSTYGFDEWVTPEWSRELRAAGLRRVAAQPGAAGPAWELFEVTSDTPEPPSP